MRSLSSRVVLGAGVAAALALCAPAIAGAQPGAGAQAPADADKRILEQLVDRGIAAQNAKDYDRAIELYEQAFAMVPHPILLFNIGQAHPRRRGGPRARPGTGTAGPCGRARRRPARGC
jgi:tetratricopeptide (TPR) repeat protein